MRLKNIIRVGDKILPMELDGSGVLRGYHPATYMTVDRIAIGPQHDWMEECRGVPCVYWNNGGGRWPVSHCKRVN